MIRRTIAAGMLLALTAAPLEATPVIDGGTYYLEPGVTAQLTVTVSGGDAVPGIEFVVQIGDGGVANGGTHAAPTITAVDLTGAGKVFAGAVGSNPQTPGPLMYLNDVTVPDTDPPTIPPPTVPAAGTLATVTIDTTGALGGSYPLRLKGVYASAFPGGLDTSFTPYGPTPTVNDGRIAILHTMTWNNGGPGTWTGGTWNGSTWNGTPAYPDDSAKTIIDTAGTVSLGNAQQTYNLTVSDGGQLSIAAAGSLTAIGSVTLGTGRHADARPGAGLTMPAAPGLQLGGGTLAISGGAYALGIPVTAAGGALGTPLGGDSLTLNALLTAAASNTLNKTGSGTATIAGGIDHAGAIAVQGGLLKYDLAAGKPVTIGPAATLSIDAGATVELAGALSGTGAGGNYVDITNNSTAGGLLVSTANQAVGAIAGSGATSIAAGASLTADSLAQTSLDIAATGSLNTTGGVTLGSGGALTLAPGAGLTTSGVQLNGATLAISGGAYSLTAPVSAAGGALGTAAGGDSLNLNGLLTAAASTTLNKTGSGTATIAGGIDHQGAIAVQGGLLKYDLAAGKTVAIGPAATLSIDLRRDRRTGRRLSGTSAGGNSIDITNNSTAGGLLVSTANQAVGAIAGSGATSIAAGASLTADSIVQNTLQIGAGGSVVIRETTSGAGAQAVPEPAALLLLLGGLLPLAAYAWRKRTTSRA